ncbi:hypothetical protein BCR44DRAFT_1428420 [Catenaria anguillulae PL171]|uniref:Ankyrin repeat-containing domain protein n=1 Tax=Catenaria anguillulae PL171 TaxID=765915 RepID=A0A1Y2HVH6_9FUNG|nr:hypothetical protein BCR44DRAFT_1428420 [Catenaria anguillulae PL171]
MEVTSPVLPHPLVELIIAVAALTAPRSTTIVHLARILPPTQVPLAYATILRIANRYKAPSGLLDDSHELIDPTCMQSIDHPPNDIYLGIDRPMSPHKAALFRPILLRMFPHLSRIVLAESECAFLDNIVRCCAYMGDLDLLQRLLDMGADLIECERVLDAASEVGHVNVLQWFLDSHLVAAGTSFSNAATALASLNGHVHVLDWWRTNETKVGVISDGDDLFSNVDVISSACAKSQLAVLDWLHSYFESTGENNVDFTPLTYGWVDAAENNQVGVLEWLKANKIPFPQSGSGYGMYCWIDYACNGKNASGCIEVLDWWYENTNRKQYSFKAIEWASALGRLNVLQWWAAKEDLVFKYSPSALRMASIHGHVHVLLWFATKVPSYHLLFQSPSTVTLPPQALPQVIPRDIPTLVAFGRTDYLASLGSVSPNEELVIQVFEAATSHGQVGLLQLNLAAWQLLNPRDDGPNKCDLSSAAASNSVATLLWCEMYLPGWYSGVAHQEDWIEYATKAIESQADLGLSWMLDTGKLDSEASDLYYCLNSACFLADLNMLNMILAKMIKNNPQELAQLDTNDSLLTILAFMGHVAGLEWWSSNELPVCKSTLPIDYASRRGKLAVLVWWHACSDWPFLWSEAAIRWAVEYKHTKVIKWWLGSGLVKDQVLLRLLQDGTRQD